MVPSVVEAKAAVIIDVRQPLILLYWSLQIWVEDNHRWMTVKAVSEFDSVDIAQLEWLDVVNPGQFAGAQTDLTAGRKAL